jgi:hypothetical protein
MDINTCCININELVNKVFYHTLPLQTMKEPITLNKEKEKLKTKYRLYIFLQVFIVILILAIVFILLVI